MTTHYGFLPDAARAGELDRRMHRELGHSLEHVRTGITLAVHFDDSPIRALVESLRSGNVYAPDVFGTYYDLVVALIGEDTAKAEQHLADLARAQPVMPGSMAIRALATPGVASWSDLYRRKMTQDEANGVQFTAPASATFEAFRKQFADAMALAEEVLPELAAEVRALVRDVVCVGSAPDAPMAFQGGSHYQLWGALFLNADYHAHPLALLEAIAHESAHSLLFGFCIDEPLVSNDDEARYPSPLRNDPRPMDGIFHATFVSARMHWAMARLLDSGRLQTMERELAAAAHAESIRAFRAGHTVVEKHAKMSNFAAELMDGARTAMSELTV